MLTIPRSVRIFIGSTPIDMRSRSTIATCEANEVNPVAYLAHVLLRVQTHPAAHIDELLPHKWRGPSAPLP